uniref:EH domain-binding protein 1 n=1 Tax=Hymenolepis diminuta TaxID=6216 RepID=A0A0R3SNC4_HYMDI
LTQLRSELLNADFKGSQTQERETTDLELPKRDSDDSSFTKITSEMEFDTEQFPPDNQDL